LNGELEPIQEAIVRLKIDNVEMLVKKALDAGFTVAEIQNAVKQGSEEVGRKFEAGEYFLSDLIMAGETMKTAVTALKQHITEPAGKSGRVVIGTIKGDLHDIGKDIVGTFLAASGFEVFDLGIDVSPKRFADEARARSADIVGVSALLSVAFPMIRQVPDEVESLGVRHSVKIIGGGAALREEHAEKLNIDAAVNDAVEGLEKIKSWMSARHLKT